MTTSPLLDTSDGFYKHLLESISEGVAFVDPQRRILFWNSSAERITGYAAEEAVGKSCAELMLRHVHEDGHPRCDGHCLLAQVLADGCVHEAEGHMRHRDGRIIPASFFLSPLKGDDGRIIGAVEIFQDNSAKLSALETLATLKRMVHVDPLTGLSNRRYVERKMRARLEEMTRYGWTFGVLFIDLDGFKTLNDTYGHRMGDQALVKVAEALTNSARSYDLIGRWGGDEFIAVITMVDRVKMQVTAERFRATIEALRLGEDAAVRVSTSIGGTLARPGDTLETLIARADSLLYQSKAAGRNCVALDG